MALAVFSLVAFCWLTWRLVSESVLRDWFARVVCLFGYLLCGLCVCAFAAYVLLCSVLVVRVRARVRGVLSDVERQWVCAVSECRGGRGSFVAVCVWESGRGGAWRRCQCARSASAAVE
jgi:hypothetical protein